MARVEDLRARGMLPLDWAPAATLARRYAGFWRRVGASLVDCHVFLPVTLLFGFVIEGPVADTIAQPLWLGYVVPLDAQGATLGKRALGIKVTDAADQPPGARRSALRHVLDYAALLLIFVPADPRNDLSAAALLAIAAFWLVALVDILWMLGNDEHQTLHDKLAGTYVVRA